MKVGGSTRIGLGGDWGFSFSVAKDGLFGFVCVHGCLRGHRFGTKYRETFLGMRVEIVSFGFHLFVVFLGFAFLDCGFRHVAGCQ